MLRFFFFFNKNVYLCRNILAKILSMTDEGTQNPLASQRELGPRERFNVEESPQYAQQTQQAQEASGVCPHCGNPLDDDADFCESCRHYVRQNVCSFCGTHLSPQDAFCPECGSPRGGIVCPVCHTLSDFAFCKQCGTPLTEEAVKLVAKMKHNPIYQEMVQLAQEYDQLSMEIPTTSERERAHLKATEQFRERVLRLLAQDEGVAQPDIPPLDNPVRTKEELAEEKEKKLARLAELLSKMETPPNPSPAHVRNYAMAQKPAGVRLAWVCNWKHAMHSSPCGCAKPQLGGKWVVLGRGNKQEVKDDI